jgi:hypothetical protein
MGIAIEERRNWRKKKQRRECHELTSRPTCRVK